MGSSMNFLLLAFVLPGFILGCILGGTVVYHLHFDSVQYNVEQVCKGPDCTELNNRIGSLTGEIGVINDEKFRVREQIAECLNTQHSLKSSVTDKEQQLIECKAQYNGSISPVLFDKPDELMKYLLTNRNNSISNVQISDKEMIIKWR